jgi:hypothetical protein
MKAQIWLVRIIALFWLMQTGGCTLDRDVDSDLLLKPKAREYSPGFTAYTTGFGGHGGYLNGYGPAFWNPRYVYYSGYAQGYAAGN